MASLTFIPYLKIFNPAGSTQFLTPSFPHLFCRKFRLETVYVPGRHLRTLFPSSARAEKTFVRGSGGGGAAQIYCWHSPGQEKQPPYPTTRYSESIPTSKYSESIPTKNTQRVFPPKNTQRVFPSTNTQRVFPSTNTQRVSPPTNTLRTFPLTNTSRVCPSPNTNQQILTTKYSSPNTHHQIITTK